MVSYHSLTRRELQALCKQHKIPANKTNVFMADALTTLLGVSSIFPTRSGMNAFCCSLDRVRGLSFFFSVFLSPFLLVVRV
jgi:hypothetical protein